MTIEASGTRPQEDGPAPPPTYRIHPRARFGHVDVGELVAYRDLLLIFIWRDIKVRYKQTIIGVGWALLQPAATAAVFAVLFGVLFGLQTGDTPYALFAYVALVPWAYLTHALTKATNSVVEAFPIISRVYFPRLLAPLAAVLAALADFVVGLAMLALLLPLYGIQPQALWAAPLFLLLLVALTLGVGLWLAAFNVEYRDVGNALPFLLQIWLFLTPVFYASAIIPERWRFVYGLNPMSGVVEGFRWALLETTPPPAAPLLLASLAGAGLALASGLIVYAYRAETFADLV